MFYQTYTARNLPSACTAVTPGCDAMVTSAATRSVRRTPYNVLSMGMTQQFFVLFIPGDLNL